MIDFDKLEGNDILVAQNKGVDNCTTTLKLKDNFTFREKSICFGITDGTGYYHLQNDAILFDNTSRNKKEFHKFAVIDISKNMDILNLYKNLKDTTKILAVTITKNKLGKLKEKSLNSYSLR